MKGFISQDSGCKEGISSEGISSHVWGHDFLGQALVFLASYLPVGVVYDTFGCSYGLNIQYYLHTVIIVEYSEDTGGSFIPLMSMMQEV